MSTLTQRVLERAHDLGFELANIAPAIRLPHAEAYEAWLQNGFHGKLSYMERNGDLRVHPGTLFEGTKSVISVGMFYGQAEEGLVSRYARGDDYHYLMKSKLRELGAFVRAEAGGDPETRAFVDSAPLLERDVALLAGLGWVGKNACVIHQKLGSYMLLGELCVGVDLEVNDTPHPQRCGTCHRCIDACPTGAIVAPRVIDARRCISYLTIELRGSIPRDLRPLIGTHLFGCDICQSVCPWNRKALPTRHAAFKPIPEVQNLSLIELLGLSNRGFERRFKRSPIFRTGRTGLLRNACVVLGNLGDRDAIPALRDTLERHLNPTIRGHAAWALGTLAGEHARDALDAKFSTETHEDVKEELRYARAMIA